MNPEVFTYDTINISADNQTVDFSFSLQHLSERFSFTEQLYFPVKLKNSYEVDGLLQAIHIALGISYYKLFVPPTIEHPYAMTAETADFWNTIWRRGLGEFLYTNKLDIEKLAQFKQQDGLKPTGEKTTAWQQKAMLGLGGGKDSVVGGELLKAINVPFEAFVLATGEHLGQTKEVATAMSVPINAIERRIDKTLLKLNERADAYTGHIPISIIFALVGSILAANNRYSYTVVANEASASTPQINSNGNHVNHQWSKSFESEQGLQNYLHQTVSRQLTYFSAIRPLNSVTVAKLFSNYPTYFTKFTSDNFVFRIDQSKRPNGRWSLNSPKSLSSFILLAPWLNEASLREIFSRNFLNEDTLVELFLRLVGKQGTPPLDCVGTIKELKASLNTLVQQKRFTDSYLVKSIIGDDFIGSNQPQVEDFLHIENEEAFPAELQSQLLATISEGLQA